MALIFQYTIVGTYYNAFLLSCILKYFQGSTSAFNYISLFFLNLDILSHEYGIFTP